MAAGCKIAGTFKREAKSEQLKSARYAFIGTEENLCNYEKEDGRILINASSNIPDNFFYGTERVFILAGMGGQTGTNLTPVIAAKAKSAGVRYVAAVIILPFHFEGKQRSIRALDGAKKIKRLNLDLVVILENEKLTEKYADLDFMNAFNHADRAVLEAIEESLESED